MLRIYLIGCLWLISTNWAAGQTPAGLIRGILTDAEGGHPAAFELVTLVNHSKVLTDENGEFQFSGLEPGNYTLITGGIHFEEAELKEIEISLTRLVNNLGVITATQKALQIPEANIVGQMESISSGTRISSVQLKQTQPLGTEEVLKTIPSVIVSGDMGISNRLNVGIRGSYPRRADKLLVMEDGSPIAPAPYLAPSAYYNPPSERLDGIEVIKGADLLAFGPQTMYGAINYITKKPPVDPTLHLQLTAGENQYRSAFLTYGGTWNKTGAEIQLLSKHFGGFIDNGKSDILNFTGKIYSYLSEKSALYLKLNIHSELSNATYSGITPFTFETDPRQNPFDADILKTERYAMDIKHNYLLGKNAVLNTQVYASRFVRDWWRQNTSLVKAQDALTYLGEDIYNDRYSYLDGLTFGDNDYIRVGKVVNGKETTSSHDRSYYVAGLQENLKWNWGTTNQHRFEAGLKIHGESFGETEATNDSTRFANSGRATKELITMLWAPSGFVRNEFVFGNLRFSAGVRSEYISMTQTDRYKASLDPAYDPASGEYSTQNQFFQIMPGGSVKYTALADPERGKSLELYAGAYKGYSPPTSGVGFLSVENGSVSKPVTDDDINMKAETSFNHEAGASGSPVKGVSAQATWFHELISNFYAAGRNEAFESLGKVTIYGGEFSLTLEPTRWFSSGNHKITLSASGTVMKSRILSGTIFDSNLGSMKHTDETRSEIINMINETPGGFNVYYASASGGDSLVTGTFTTSDFSSIKKLTYNFGEGGLENQRAPYVPAFQVTGRLGYQIKGFQAGVLLTIVGSQFTDYLNVEHETGDGALGKLESFRNIDVNVSYTFTGRKNRSLTLFATGKNVENQVYRASRLHRLTSGIMPGGFRQINGGIVLDF